jgi:hypothetical protein
MEKQSDPAFLKARDDAIRLLAQGCGLNSEQISVLLLDQLHLATNTLKIETSDIAGVESPFSRPAVLDLDADTRQAMIAWLVLRPDGANNHLFPGDGLDGLAPQTIQAVLDDRKRAPTVERRASDAEEGESGASEETGTVSLEEIQALREQLAAVEDDLTAPVSDAKPGGPSSRARSRGLPEAPVRRSGPKADRKKPEDGERVMRTGPQPGVRRPEPAGGREPSPASARYEGGEREKKSVQPGDREASLLSEPAPSFPLPPRVLAAATAALIVVCCIAALIGGGLLVGGSDLGQTIAGGLPLPEGILGETAATEEAAADVPTEESSSEEAPTVTPTSPATPTEPPEPPPTEPPTPEPTEAVAAPTEELPSPTPVVVVVTATSTPEPSPTATSAATNTPAAAAMPTSPPATPTAEYRYAAPELLEPEDGGIVPGRLNYLKWEPVGPLADNEWYAVRLVFLQQGQPVYNGDRLKDTVWQVPERFYYKADGPGLQYEWFVFVEQDNGDGSATQISPESEHRFFKWE